MQKQKVFMLLLLMPLILKAWNPNFSLVPEYSMGRTVKVTPLNYQFGKSAFNDFEKGSFSIRYSFTDKFFAGISTGFGRTSLDNELSGNKNSFDTLLNSILSDHSPIFLGIYLDYATFNKIPKLFIGCFLGMSNNYEGLLATSINNNPNLNYTAEDVRIKNALNYKSVGFYCNPYIYYQIKSTKTNSLKYVNVKLSFDFWQQNLRLNVNRKFNNGSQTNEINTYFVKGSAISISLAGVIIK
jgi:hypothetical protein